MLSLDMIEIILCTGGGKLASQSIDRETIRSNAQFLMINVML